MCELPYLSGRKKGQKLAVKGYTVGTMCWEKYFKTQTKTKCVNVDS